MARQLSLITERFDRRFDSRLSGGDGPPFAKALDEPELSWTPQVGANAATAMHQSAGPAGRWSRADSSPALQEEVITFLIDVGSDVAVAQPAAFRCQRASLAVPELEQDPAARA